MTIKDKKIISQMIENDGQLEEDQFSSIWEYKSEKGETLYAAFLSEDHDMFTSPYVFNPELLWDNYMGKIREPN